MSNARHLCVVMERRALHGNRWADHQWEAIGVLPDMGDAVPRTLRRDAACEQWLYPALPLMLHTDEVEDYRLNLSAPEPRLFVISRMQEMESETGSAKYPVPAFLSVSYGEAARMLDAGETVDGIPMPTEIWDWAAAFAEKHFVPPEPKRGKRYASTQEAKAREDLS